MPFYDTDAENPDINSYGPWKDECTRWFTQRIQRLASSLDAATSERHEAILAFQELLAGPIQDNGS